MAKKNTSQKDQPRGHSARETVTTVLRAPDGEVRVGLKISDAEAKADLAALRKTVSTKHGARKFLREVGILTPKGKLTRRFGG